MTYKREVLIIFLLMLIGIHKTTAQQDPIYSQYNFNALALNPAYAGTKDALSMMLISRQQWVGFDGAPSTQYFMTHTPIGASNVGVGLNIINDKTGPVSQTGGYMDYSYRIRTSTNTWLSMGLKLGINHIQSDLSRLATFNPNPDPIQMDKIDSRNLFNIGTGLYFYSNTFYLGVSTPKLIENKLASSSQGVEQKGKEVRHFYFMGGLVIKLSEQLKLKPSVLYRTHQGAGASTDVNLNALFGERLWVGAMYRLSDSFGANLKFMITPQFFMGYAFDKNTNELKNYNSGSHEIMIGYDFTFKRKNVQNPRYF